jgi:hypothetical protein
MNANAPLTLAIPDGSTGNPSFSINSFTGSQPGAVPVSGGGTVNFLRADGTWAPAVKKYAAALVGTTSPETVTHNLGTQDVTVTVVNSASPYQMIQVDWQAASINTVSIIFNPALGAGWRVIVMG